MLIESYTAFIGSSVNEIYLSHPSVIKELRKYFHSIGVKKMSLAHVRLIQIVNTNALVKYRAETFDFSSEGDWETMGILKIDKSRKKYSFQLSKLAIENKVIPPEIFEITEEKRKNFIGEKYKDHGWGSWSICINHWANLFINDNNYPTNFPKHFFLDDDLST